MYSRAKDRPKAPIRLPDHYSGWAFKDLPPVDSEDSPIPHTAPPEAVAALSIPATNEVESPTPLPCELPMPKHTTSQVTSQVKSAPAFLQPFENLFGKVGNAFPFAHGFGFDELLILGLILLLAHNDHDPDILLLLGLLLFCG